MLLPPPPPAIQAPAPSDLPAQLTLGEALRIFRQRGLDLLLAEAAVGQAEGDLRSAGALPAPTLGLATGRTQGYVPTLPGQSVHAYGASLETEQGLESARQNLNDYWNGLFGLEQAVGKEFSR